MQIKHRTYPLIRALAFATFGILIACTSSPKTDQEVVVAEVESNRLTRMQMQETLGDLTGRPDSTRIVEEFIAQWAREMLLYEKARKNVADLSLINKLTDDYRRNLIIYEYEKQLVSERINSEITDEELEEFFTQHKSRFLLKEPVVRGIFLKIPVDAPQLQEIKKWVKRINPESLEKIEKYTLQNAIVYEYFQDQWTTFSEILENIPYQVTNTDRFLKEKDNLEVTDDKFWYYLYVSAYRLSGTEQPFEYARPRIQEVLVNRKKKGFLQQLSQELYEEAIENEKIKRTELSALN